MARSFAVFLVGFLAFACATAVLAEDKAAPEPTDAEAQFELGRRLAWGLDGVRKDQRAAVKWFQKAAEQGHARAQMQLGMAYQKGRGVRRNVQESIKWIRRAAEQGHPKAQFELGIAYRDGKGVPQDAVLGLMWLLLSKEGGGIASRVAAPGLARKLKERDRKEAWKLAYQWRQDHGPPRTLPGAAKSRSKATPPDESAAAPGTPADSETAPKLQDGAPPERAPSQEGDAPASG